MHQERITARDAQTGVLVAGTRPLSSWSSRDLDLQSENKENGVKRIWQTMWAHKWLIVSSSLICASFALGFSLLQKPEYRAQTSLEIEDLNSHFLQMDEVDPVNRGNADSFLSTQIDMLSSQRLLGSVIDRLQLEREYENASPGLIHSLLRRVNPDLFPLQTTRERALEDLKQNLNISAPRSTSRVVSIEFVSEDRQLAAKVPNTLAQEFINQGIELRMQSAHGLNSWLVKELEQSRSRLEASEEALQRYGQAAGLLFTDETNSVAETKLKQVQAELSKAQADRITKQSTYELISKADPDSLGDIAGNARLQEYQIKLTDLRRQLADAQALMTPTHYKVKELAAQVAELEAAVASAQRQTADRLTDDYQAARRREDLLKGEYEAQTRLVTAQDARASRYNVLKNEVETNRQLYDAMLQKAKSVGLAAAMRTSNIAIFDPAEAPLRPYKPMPAMNAALGLLSGLLLSSVFVFLRDRWDQSVRVPGDVSSYLNVPELGVIPSANKLLSAPERKSGGLNQWSQLQLSGDAPKALREAFVAPNNGDLSHARMADSIRAIVASILLSGEGRKSPGVITVTSPSPKEGKTSNAINLAVALSSMGKRVLLIDADLRKPKVHEVFGVPNDGGFSDLLAELPQTELKKGLQNVQTTGVPDLSVLTAGKSRSAASNLLYGPAAAQLISKLREYFDAVLIDTPPVLALPDARLLGSVSDGVVLVCRAGATNRALAKIAVDLLMRDGANVIGTILNDFNPKSASYYYGGYDSNYSEAAS
jgi:polysaccharide biosynthesis transport protein